MSNGYKIDYIREFDGWCHWLISGTNNNDIKGKSKGAKDEVEKKLKDWVKKTNSFPKKLGSQMK